MLQAVLGYRENYATPSVLDWHYLKSPSFQTYQNHLGIPAVSCGLYGSFWWLMTFRPDIAVARQHDLALWVLNLLTATHGNP